MFIFMDYIEFLMEEKIGIFVYFFRVSNDFEETLNYKEFLFFFNNKIRVFDTNLIVR